MSITALQMITDSARLANIIDQIQAPSAEQGQQWLRSLNQMMADWQTDGIRLGWRPIAALDDTLPLADEDERGVKYNFAVEICGEYGIEPSTEVGNIAVATFARFAKSSSEEVVADLSGLPTEEAAYRATWPIG